MHDDPATTTPPRLTDPDDAHVGRRSAGRRRARCPSARPIAEPAGSARSSDRSATTTGSAAPVEVPDPVNRCAALHDAVPQSMRQQELVCLTSGHVNCPRYLRGAHAAGRTARPRRRQPGRRPRPSPASVAVLVGGLPAVARVRRRQRWPDPDRGGRAADADRGRPGRGRRPQLRAEHAAPRPPTPTVTAAPTPTASPTPSREPEPRRRARSSRPSPTATNEAGRDLPPGATASRMKLLTPCSGQAEVLHLRDPLGRQPLQHRQLLRRVLLHRQGLEPVDGQRPQGRARAPDPAAHELADIRAPHAGPFDGRWRSMFATPPAIPRAASATRTGAASPRRPPRHARASRRPPAD